MFLGIDFGTCFSSVTTFDENGNPLDRVFADDITGEGMPSVLAIENGTVFSGFACERNNNIPLDKKIRNLKMQIRSSKDGDPLDSPPDESAAYPEYKAYSRLQFLGFFLQDLIEKAVEGIQEQGTVEDDDRIEGITITVPVGLGHKKTMRTSYVDTLIALLRIALNCEKMRKLLPAQNEVREVQITALAEPVAAALAYLEKSPKCRRMLREKPKGKILVVDIGGGKVDLTAVGYEILEDKKRYEVLAEGGDLSLGGNDWDDALFSLINKNLFQGTLSVSDDAYCKRMLEINRVKHILSTEDRYLYTDSITQKTLEITREEFEECSRPLVERLQGLVEKIVGETGGIGEFGKIILVGGASKMPMVKSGILQLYPGLGKDIFDVYLPHRAIAIGAALYCGMRDSVDVVVKLKAQASYGVNYTDSRTNEERVQNLIFKGQEFGEGGSISAFSRNYVPQREEQKFITWQIYESDSMEKDAPLTDAYHFNGMKYTLAIPKKYYESGRSREYTHWAVMKLSDSGQLDLTFYDGDGKIPVSRIKREIIVE